MHSTLRALKRRWCAKWLQDWSWHGLHDDGAQQGRKLGFRCFNWPPFAFFIWILFFKYACNYPPYIFLQLGMSPCSRHAVSCVSAATAGGLLRLRFGVLVRHDLALQRSFEPLHGERMAARQHHGHLLLRLHWQLHAARQLWEARCKRERIRKQDNLGILREKSKDNMRKNKHEAFPRPFGRSREVFGHKEAHSKR